MLLNRVLHYAKLFESMSVKEWKIKNGFLQMPEEQRQRFNDILAWYRNRNNQKLRSDLPLEGMRPKDVEEILGGMYEYNKMKEMLGDKNSYNLVFENESGYNAQKMLADYKKMIGVVPWFTEERYERLKKNLGL